MNPFLDQTVDNVLGDIVRNYNLSVQPSFNNAMVRSGSFGNTGIQQMNNEAQRQLQTSLGRAATDLRYGDYQFDQNFNRQLFNDAFGQNQQMFQNQMGLLGLQNNMNNQSLGLGNQIQQQPMNYLQGFTGIANSIGQGGGSSSQTSQGQGNPLMGALGGWQLGGALSNGWGNSFGQAWGNAMKNSGVNGGDQIYG